jgi:hypothetical protein
MSAALALASASSPPDEPSGARRELAATIERLAELLRERDTVAEPVNRLSAIEGGRARATGEV